MKLVTNFSGVGVSIGSAALRDCLQYLIVEFSVIKSHFTNSHQWVNVAFSDNHDF